jgi:hypothetical protein
MPKKQLKGKVTITIRASALSQQDANKFKKSAKIYAKNATSSKKKAQDKLKSMGIYTETGQISKKYG